MKQDLTGYSDEELSLHVFNTEYLYCLRHYPAALEEAIENLFHFTPAQFDVLLQDIYDDINET